MTKVHAESLPRVVAAVRRYCRASPTEDDTGILNAASMQPLAGGRNNAVFALEVAGRTLCFKCYRVDERHRAERECQVLSALTQAGCAVSPTPHFYDPDPLAPVVVMDFLPGESLGGQKLEAPELSALATAVAELHAVTPDSLPAITRPVNSDSVARLSWVRAEIDRLERETGDDNLLDAAAGWLASPDAALLETPAARVFSRGDPSLANCLWDGERIRFVDFEYAGWSDRAFDLADLVEHIQSRGTSDDAWTTLVQHFTLTAEETARFNAARRLVALFWLVRLRPRADVTPAHRTEFDEQRERVGELLEV